MSYRHLSLQINHRRKLLWYAPFVMLRHHPAQVCCKQTQRLLAFCASCILDNTTPHQTPLLPLDLNHHLLSFPRRSSNNVYTVSCPRVFKSLNHDAEICDILLVSGSNHPISTQSSQTVRVAFRGYSSNSSTFSRLDHNYADGLWRTTQDDSREPASSRAAHHRA